MLNAAYRQKPWIRSFTVIVKQSFYIALVLKQLTGLFDAHESDSDEISLYKEIPIKKLSLNNYFQERQK